MCREPIGGKRLSIFPACESWLRRLALQKQWRRARLNTSRNSIEVPLRLTSHRTKLSRIRHPWMRRLEMLSKGKRNQRAGASSLVSGGELRERVAFDKRGIFSDGYGNEVAGDFAEQFIVPARIWPQKGIGNETLTAARMTGLQPMVIRVRVSNQTLQITNAWRARDVRRGIAYNIRSVANMDEHRAYLDILAQSGEAQG